MSSLREDARIIYSRAIEQSLPDVAVKKILADIRFSAGRIILIAVGKAAWTMANAACEMLPKEISAGVLVTKYGHSRGLIPGISIIEAGHPILDANSFKGASAAIQAVTGLTEEDTVLFLLSGGGSALFELSDLPLRELQDINQQLTTCGASIQEINAIRKRLSRVKGGRFAQYCAPARVVSIMLSDIIDHRADMIASGPTSPDLSTCADAVHVAEHYGLRLSSKAKELLYQETPKKIDRAECHVCGSVGKLCLDAQEAAQSLGYETVVLTDTLDCLASEAGRFLASIAQMHAKDGKRLAYIAGGETVVELKGNGRGGRNQELALAAAEGISGLENVAIFSVGSDGTDGPTNAAGGYVDGMTQKRLIQQGYSIYDVLQRNDSYSALEACGGLIVLGPTGTNVNDISVLLIN